MAQGTESDALELERVEFGRWLNEASTEVTSEIKILENAMAARGVSNSGGRYLRELEIRFSKSADWVTEKAIAKRVELGKKFPGLLTEYRLNQLRDKLHQHADGFVKGQQTRMAMGGRHGGVSASLNQQAQMKAQGLKAKINQALAALLLEARIGIHTEEEKESPVTFKISNSTIANLNLGNVFGDITASVQTLNGHGQKELADIIRAVTEAIATSTEVQGDYRKELLEHLSVVSTEAALPPEKRKMGPLKGSITFVREGLNSATQLVALWPVVEHALKAAGMIS